MKFPYSITPFDKETNEDLIRRFRGEKEGFCQVGPSKYVYSTKYEKFAEDYYNVEIKQGDVWIVTFPRSGTTLTQELVWQLRNNFNFDICKTTTLLDRVPFFEFNIVFSEKFLEEVLRLNNHSQPAIDTVNYVNKHGCELIGSQVTPRTIKTHLPLSLLPPDLLEKGKVVYVARNPKDVAVSFYHHNQLLRAHDFVGSFQEYWGYFENSRMTFCPYWDHVIEAWNQRNHKNMCFVFYEDLVKDMPSTIRRLADFLEVSASDDQIKGLTNHLELANFRQNVPVFPFPPGVSGFRNESGKPFIRQGKINANTLEWTPELLARAEKWIEENKKRSDIEFPI